jgi:hypothetical protein
MTAINAYASATGDAAYMITDSAEYYLRGEKAGVVSRLGKKGVLIPELRIMLATCGAPGLADAFADECRDCASSFDDVIRELPGRLRSMADHEAFIRAEDPDDDANHFRLFVAGWSGERRRPELYTLQSRRADDGAGASMEPFSFVGGMRILVQPGGVTLDTLRNLGFVQGGQVIVRDPTKFLTAVIDWQRRNCPFENVAGRYCIGGEATVTRIDAKGVSERVVRRWPDQVGELITPEAEKEATATAPPAGMSREQRRRFERMQRKAKAA